MNWPVMLTLTRSRDWQLWQEFDKRLRCGWGRTILLITEWENQKMKARKLGIATIRLLQQSYSMNWMVWRSPLTSHAAAVSGPPACGALCPHSMSSNPYLLMVTLFPFLVLESPQAPLLETRPCLPAPCNVGLGLGRTQILAQSGTLPGHKL